MTPTAWATASAILLAIAIAERHDWRSAGDSLLALVCITLATGG